MTVAFSARGITANYSREAVRKATPLFYTPNMTTSMCVAWRRNPDGSWTSVRPWRIGGVSGGAGITVGTGLKYAGFDVAAWLDANC